MRPPLLEVRGLRIQRGGRLALEVDHLTVSHGERLAVIGPNGAGKSSLLLALARLIPFQRGEIYLNGLPASAETALTYRRRLALVMQEPLLFDASVTENIALGLRFRRLKRTQIEERVTRWMSHLGIAPLAPRRANQLSGGEGQRVSLARALALEPELLLLDEPFSALDAPTRLSLLNDLERLLAESGTTTVFITHSLSEARHLGTRLAVVLDGKIAQVAPPDQVLAHPASPQISAFLGI